MNITDQLEELLREEKSVKGEHMPVARALMEILLSKAMKGDVKAINLIFDRIEGKLSTTSTGREGGSIAFDSDRAVQAINERIEGIAGSGDDSSSETSSQD